MKILSEICLISALICTSCYISGCKENNSSDSSEVNSTSTLSEDENDLGSSDNDTQTQSSAYRYTPYDNDSENYWIRNIRSVNEKIYQFESKWYNYTNTFAMDIDNLSVKKLNINVEQYYPSYMYNNYLYTIKYRKDSNYLCVTDPDNPSDTKEVKINEGCTSPLAVSQDGNIYYCYKSDLYVYNKDLELIRQSDLSELAIATDIRYICCDSNNNIYILSYGSIEDKQFLIYKLDSSLNKIADATYDFDYYPDSFFINKDGTLNISSFDLIDKKSKVYSIDTENGKILSENEIDGVYTILKGTGNYDYTYYSSDNKLYGYLCADESSDMLIDLSHEVCGSIMSLKAGEHWLPSSVYSGTDLLITSSIPNTYIIKIINDEKADSKEYPVLCEGNEPNIENSFISSSGDTYFMEKIRSDDIAKTYTYDVNKITTDGKQDSLSLQLPDDFYVYELAVDDTNNIYFLGSYQNKYFIKIFDPDMQHISDATIENVYQIKSYFIFGNSLYIYYIDTNEKNHMVMINSETKKFQTVPEFENTNFNKIINGTDEYDLYVVEGTYLHGYSFEKNKYTQLTDNLETDQVHVLNIFAVNKDKFIVQSSNPDNYAKCYLTLEKQK